jgi:hypothetical protein
VIVRLHADADPELVDLDRLDRLHAEASVPLSDVRLAGWCRSTDDDAHVWLDVARCRSIGTAAAGDAWGERFDEMIADAASKGWTNEARTDVRAHVEHIGS